MNPGILRWRMMDEPKVYIYKKTKLIHLVWKEKPHYGKVLAQDIQQL